MDEKLLQATDDKFLNLPFALPPVTHEGDKPVWTGKGFRIGEQIVSVLSYSCDLRGWSDGLTVFHENLAGTSHMIDKASRSYALGQMSKHIKGPCPVVLEVGCSSGFLLQSIREHFPDAIPIGSDVVGETLRRLAIRMPDIPLLQFDLVRCPLPDNSIDMVLLLNVLEHIEDDEAALRQVWRILKPGGTVLIEAPYGPHLYDIYDRMLCHQRRYKQASLERLIRNAGLKVKKKSHLGFTLYPGFYLVKKRNRRLMTMADEIVQKAVKQNIYSTGNSLFLNFILVIELFLSKWLSYPIGIRCLFTCEK